MNNKAEVKKMNKLMNVLLIAAFALSGYVTWSSTSCGERPAQSVKTIT
jgi:hypothetical protein